jgi:hypothetical protein
MLALSVQYAGSILPVEQSAQAWLAYSEGSLRSQKGNSDVFE